MIKKYIYIFIIFLLCYGCGKSNKFKVPPPDRMAIIIADVHMAQATLTFNNSFILSETHNGGYKLVLEKYGLDKAGFDSSIIFYTSQPAVYQKIHEDVLAILTEKEMSARALKDDSVKVSKPRVDTLVNTSIHNIWKGDRLFTINNNDSTRLKTQFKFKVDSILGGDVILKAKYRFRSFQTIKLDNRMRLFVKYSNGAMDSSSTVIADTIGYKEFSTQISLKRLDVVEVSGSLMNWSLKKQSIVELIDIRLDWIKPLSVTEPMKE